VQGGGVISPNIAAEGVTLFFFDRVFDGGINVRTLETAIKSTRKSAEPFAINQPAQFLHLKPVLERAEPLTATKGTRKSAEPFAINHPSQLLRLKQVLALVPVSRSTWLSGVKTGRFPAPIKNNRCVFWSAASILELLEKMSNQEA